MGGVGRILLEVCKVWGCGGSEICAVKRGVGYYNRGDVDDAGVGYHRIVLLFRMVFKLGPASHKSKMRRKSDERGDPTYRTFSRGQADWRERKRWRGLPLCSRFVSSLSTVFQFCVPSSKYAAGLPLMISMLGRLLLCPLRYRFACFPSCVLVESRRYWFFSEDSCGSFFFLCRD